MRVLAIIPSRYSSTRLPGKPLADICGHPMIEWVYRRAQCAVPDVCVATDDSRIYDAVRAFGGTVTLTSASHTSGTSRCIEVLEKMGSTPSYDIIINVQGDEPFIDPESLKSLIKSFSDRTVDIATLVRPFQKEEPLDNPNWPKVVLNAQGNALYFSRSVIPYPRNTDESYKHLYYKHIGVYAYRTSTLQSLSKIPPSTLEKVEGLEQLSWLYAGLTIHSVIVENEGLSVDTPDDLTAARKVAQAHFHRTIFGER